MTTTYMYWEYMVIGMGKTPLLQLMFILRICFVDGIGKPFGMGLPLRKQHPCFAVLEATTSPPSGGEIYYQRIAWDWKLRLGLTFHPRVQKCEILIVIKFGSIHCVSNGFLDRFLHSLNHLLLQKMLNKIPLNVVHIIVHILVYDGIVIML